MKKLKFLKKVWGVAKEYKWQFILSYLILLLGLGFSQVLPLLLGNLVDAAVYQADIAQFLKCSAIYTIVFIGNEVCNFTQLQHWQRLNNKYVYGLRLRCYEKVLRLKAKDLANSNTGDIIQTINDDTMEFHHIMQRYAMRVINAGISAIVSIIIVACMKWEMAIIIVFLIPISIFFTNKIKKKMKIASQEIREKQGQYNSWLLEIIKGIREIKLFAAEKNTAKRYLEHNSKLIQLNNKQTKIQFTANQIIGLIDLMSNLIFYLVSALFVVNGSINVAEYIAIAAYYTSITWSIQRILRGNMEYQAREVAIERVFQLLDSDFEDEKYLVPLTLSNGEITLDHLSFAYKAEKDVLKDVTYTINAGKRVGVIGESGVGKSTLAHILIKFFEPDNGRVVIDGQDLAKCTYSSVRDNIGIVSQETIIFDATIKDNICFGAEISDEIIWEVLDRAYLKAEIEKLPDGIYTKLEQGGQNLSGGQNQRLAIARLIFRNPKIVILDEATSALDENSEKIVQQALDELTAGRTSIVISHRLNSILHTNDIIVLKNGEIVANGSYEYLLENNETFSEFFSAQAKKLEAMANEV